VTDLRKLIAKLNPTCRAALEHALSRAMASGHDQVTIVHWLAVLADRSDCDLVLIMDRLAVDIAWQRQLLARAIERMPHTGQRPVPALTPDVVAVVRAAWVVASIDFDAAQIRSGHILLAVLDDAYPEAARDVIAPLAVLSALTIRQRFHAVTEGSSESGGQRPPRRPDGGAAPEGASIHWLPRR
jgi:type VI secretion system protein VasG